MDAWDIKEKATNERQQNKQTKFIATENRMWGENKEDIGLEYTVMHGD